MDEFTLVPGSMSVLLVDDTPANISVLRETLAPVGYKLGFATSGEKALETAAHMRPDLILLDVMMPPGIDGFVTCERLKANPATADVPVIFITAKSETEDIVAGLSKGGVDYIAKPFRQEEVRARVRTHLELREFRRRLEIQNRMISEQNAVLEQRVRERTQELNETRLEVINRLGMAAEYRDNETGMHVVRMSHYSALLAQAAGLSSNECELILNASPMHDIGKIGIPDNVLLKRGKLDHDEWQIMKSHVMIGAKILSGSSHELMRLAEIIALTHQEKWDGSGYPRKLKGAGIPLAGRIVAIADVFDALTSERPYKQAWTVEAAMTELEKSSGSHFDPDLVAAFKKILPAIVKIKNQFADSHGK